VSGQWSVVSGEWGVGSGGKETGRNLLWFRPVKIQDGWISAFD
ncbi:MAG: hypothetical protein RIT02_3493, partial [Planctomycetota bacterium]